MKKKILPALILTSVIFSTIFTLSSCGKTSDTDSSSIPSSSAIASSEQSSSETSVASASSMATTSSIASSSAVSSESSSQETVVYWTPGSKDYYYTKDGSGHLARSKEVDSGTESEAKSLGKVPYQGK